jgi:hypothetical protein
VCRLAQLIDERGDVFAQLVGRLLESLFGILPVGAHGRLDGNGEGNALVEVLHVADGLCGDTFGSLPALGEQLIQLGADAPRQNVLHFCRVLGLAKIYVDHFAHMSPSVWTWATPVDVSSLALHRRLPTDALGVSRNDALHA